MVDVSREPAGQDGFWLTRSTLTAAAAAGLAMLGSTLAVFALRSQGGDFTDLLRDPAAQFDIPVYAGAISFLGVLLLVFAAGATFVGGAIRRDGLLLGVAAFSALLALDDLYMLHDYVLPNVLGIPEMAVLAVYGLAFAALIWRHGSEGNALAKGGFFLACLMLAVSAGIDATTEFTYRNVFFEDTAKLGGFAAWAAYWVQTSLRGLSPGP